MTDHCTTDFCIWRTICLVQVRCISSICHMYMTDFAYDGPFFLVPLSLSYPSSPVLHFDISLSSLHTQVFFKYCYYCTKCNSQQYLEQVPRLHVYVLLMESSMKWKTKTQEHFSNIFILCSIQHYYMPAAHSQTWLVNSWSCDHLYPLISPYKIDIASGNIIFQSAIKIDIALTKVPYLYNIGE